MEDYDAGIRYLQNTYHIPRILLSMDPVGSLACYHDLRLHEMLIFANAAASLLTIRKGARKVMPSAEEVNK